MIDFPGGGMEPTANEAKDTGFSDYVVHFRWVFIMADDKDIIDRKNVRKIQSSFSWVDHKLITGGFLDEVSTVGILVYFFLTAVSDR
ncbi:unnamed protein product, partial [marine sediment metagenome]